MRYLLSDFKKNQSIDDTKLLRSVIYNFENNDKEKVLVLDEREYHFYKEDGKNRKIHLSNTDTMKFPIKHISILLEGLENLTIIGAPSKFIFHGDQMAIALLNSKNICLKDIEIIYSMPTVNEISVIEIDKLNKSVKFKISEGQNYEVRENNVYWYSQKNSNGKYYWTEKNAHNNYGINVTYPEKRMARAYFSHQSPFENIIDIKDISNNKIEIHYKEFPLDLEEGMIFQFNSNTLRKTCGIFIENSSDINFENVDVRFMPGFGLLGQMSENLSFTNCEFKTSQESDFVTSSQADGIHISGAKGKILIDNCVFDNTHDDPINIHGTYTKVIDQEGKNTLLLKYMHHQQAGFTQYHKGDKIRFIFQETLLPVFGEREFTVVSNTIPFNDDIQLMKVQLEEDLPDFDIDEGIAVENITYNPEVTIKNSKFTNIFTRCILVSSSKKIIIENNLFYKPTLAAIYISNDANDWYESSAVKDITIKNNHFVIDSIGRTQWKHAPAIYFDPIIKKGNHVIHENILIENNVFDLYDDKALIAHNVGNLIFKDNEINQYYEDEIEVVEVDGENIRTSY